MSVNLAPSNQNIKGFNWSEVDQIEQGSPITQRVVKIIRNLIIEGVLEAGEKLPNEPELADTFKVSRSTIRTTLQTLEKEGFINRRRGIGTFVSDEPIKINNLNLNWGVTKVIESTGAIPGTEEILISDRLASPRVAKRLNFSQESQVCVVERVRTANGKRVVLSVDFFPWETPHSSFKNISHAEIEKFLVEHQSVYQLLSHYFGLEIHHALAWISPLTANGLMAEKLQIPLGSEMLYIEQVDFLSDGTAVVLADEYHVGNAFTFSLYRSN